MGWRSEQMTTLPPWASEASEGSVALLEERAQYEIPDEEPALDEEERPCWWVLSALDRFDGKEAREKYYAGL